MVSETQNQSAGNDTLFVELAGIVGAEHVLTDAESCVLFAQDVFTTDQSALAVVQPSNTEELALAVKTATEAGSDVIPRGGGMSYTSGYLPVSANAVTFDLRRMNRILEINTEDMHVTVESGCTWKELYETLSDTGYRTPY